MFDKKKILFYDHKRMLVHHWNKEMLKQDSIHVVFGLSTWEARNVQMKIANDGWEINPCWL